MDAVSDPICDGAKLVEVETEADRLVALMVGDAERETERAVELAVELAVIDSEVEVVDKAEDEVCKVPPLLLRAAEL